MTRCAKFHHLFDEVGDFCGMSPSAISQYKAYREQVKKLVNLDIDEDFVFENFPEGPGRILSKIHDDETRVRALNYVAACLKRKERVSEGDLKGTLKAWTEPCDITTNHKTRENYSKKFTNVKSVTPDNDVKVPDAPIATILKERYDTTDTDIKVSQSTDIPRQAPCIGVGTKDTYEICPDLGHHIFSDKIRGRVCDVIGVPINQLPGDGECPLERNQRLKGTKPEPFVPASEFDPVTGGKLIRGEPIKVVPVSMTKDIAEQKLVDFVRGYLTNKDREALGDILRSGELGDNYVDIFTGLIWWAIERMDGA